MGVQILFNLHHHRENIFGVQILFYLLHHRENIFGVQILFNLLHHREKSRLKLDKSKIMIIRSYLLFFIIKKYSSLKNTWKVLNIGLCSVIKKIIINVIKYITGCILHAYIMQGYPQRMRLPRRLKEMYTVCFFIFTINYSFFAKMVNYMFKKS